MLGLPRRFAAWWLLTIGLLCASLAYQGLLVRSLVLDPDLAADATSGVLSNEQLQRSLADQVGAAMTNQLLPDEVAPALESFGVDAEKDFRTAALGVVSGPQFETLYRDALRDIHRYVFTDHGQAPVIDASSLVAELRARAVEVNPAYAQYLPAESALRVTVDDGLPDLSGVRRSVDRALGVLVLVAIAGIGSAFAVHPRRDVVLRRLGRWLVSITIFQVGLALLAPVAVQALPGAAAVLAGSVLGALVPRVLAPSLAVLLFGVGAIVVGRRWRSAADRGGQATGAAAFLDPDGVGVAGPAPAPALRGVPTWAYRTDEVPVAPAAPAGPAVTAAPAAPPTADRAPAATGAGAGAGARSVFPPVSVFDDPAPARPSVRPTPRA